MSGHPRPDSLKVNVFHDGGWLAEGEISYAGHGAERRARLAAGILQQRLAGLRLRIDLIGVLSILGDDGGRLLAATPAGDVRATCGCGSPPPTTIASRPSGWATRSAASTPAGPPAAAACAPAFARG